MVKRITGWQKRNHQLSCDHYKYFGAGCTQHTNITPTQNSGQGRFP